MNDNPTLAKGMLPLELLANIPNFIANLDPKASIIGIVSLAIMLGWPYIKTNQLK